MRWMRQLAAAGTVIIVATMMVIAGASSAAAQPDFGVEPVTDPGLAGSSIGQIGVGANLGYDRLAIEFVGELAGYTVSYVEQVIDVESGEPVEVDGVAIIQIDLINVPSDPAPPQGTLNPTLPGIVQVVGAGVGVESDVHYAIGTNEPDGFRVFTMDAPTRLIIDIAHPGTVPDPTTPAPTTPTTTAAPSPISSEALQGRSDSPNDWLIYPASGLGAIAIVAGIIGWRKRHPGGKRR